MRLPFKAVCQFMYRYANKMLECARKLTLYVKKIYVHLKCRFLIMFKLNPYTFPMDETKQYFSSFKHLQATSKILVICSQVLIRNFKLFLFFSLGFCGLYTNTSTYSLFIIYLVYTN